MDSLRRIFIKIRTRRKIQFLNRPGNKGILKTGDKIELYGGYDNEPEYLKHSLSDTIPGKVIEFVESNNYIKAAVELENEIIYEELTSDIVLINLRYVDQTWSYQDINVVGVYLTEKNYKVPNCKSIYIESHARWRLKKQDK